MSRCTRANASPKSLVSVNARPPVSAASDVSVSCDAASCANCCCDAAAGEQRLAAAARLARVAAGHDRLQAARVDRDRSTTFARTAALIADRSSTWLSCPLRCMPALK